MKTEEILARQAAEEQASQASEDSKRIVEIYIGQGDRNGGTWYVRDFEVPSSLDDDDAGKVAMGMAEEELSAYQVEYAFLGVYSVWDDDDMDSYWEEYGFEDELD